MPAKKPPETWFWSHDIKPTQIASVVTPGTRLVRLSSYGAGAARRFAALVYQEPGGERRHALDLDAAQLAAALSDARPVAITVDAPAGSAPGGERGSIDGRGSSPAGSAPGGERGSIDGDARFAVVLEAGPGPLTSAHVDLDEAALRALADDRHAIVDLATYEHGGQRRFAAIVEERATSAWLFVGVTAAELDAQLIAHDAALTRLRAYRDGGATKLAAVAERGRPAGWAWYADLDGDGVAKQLERNHAYPIDLDATRDDRGVRFTVVMVRDK